MNNLLNFVYLILFLFITSNIAAQERETLPILVNNMPYEATSKSIMFADAESPKNNLNWQKGIANQKRKIIKKNTIKYSIIGAVIGAGIPFTKQLGANMLVSMIFDHPVKNYAFDSKPIISGFLTGAIAGAGIGYTIGKKKADGKGNRAKFKLIPHR